MLKVKFYFFLWTLHGGQWHKTNRKEEKWQICLSMVRRAAYGMVKFIASHKAKHQKYRTTHKKHNEKL
jgi:hypothetical protein